MWESFPHLYPGTHLLLVHPISLAISIDTSSFTWLYLALPPPSLFELYSQPRFQKKMSALVVAMTIILLTQFHPPRQLSPGSMVSSP